MNWKLFGWKRSWPVVCLFDAEDGGVAFLGSVLSLLSYYRRYNQEQRILQGLFITVVGSSACVLTRLQAGHRTVGIQFRTEA
jgi:hypothetical protein